MLNLFRRHRASCSKSGTRSPDCPSKPKCPVHFEGIDGTGKRHKPQALVDPGSGSGVRDWSRASELIREMELPTPVERTSAPQVSLEKAIDSFLALKSVLSGPETKRKVTLVLRRLRAFMEARKKTTVAEITLDDLLLFRASWDHADTTQRRDQELLRGFFKHCLIEDFIPKNPAIRLTAVKVGRPKTEPFTSDELERIFRAIDAMPDEYGRQGQPIAAQTRAFVLVMRYTGLSIGDTAKLEKKDVSGTQIRTFRKKTDEDVFTRVPSFVIEALDKALHDSSQYYFWTGRGKLHTRSSKWGTRLQKLFVLAGVRTEKVISQKRSGGKLKPDAEEHVVSRATPHMFRHTFARDLLENGATMEEVAELLGNSMKTVEQYYSKWDVRRQTRINERLEQLWSHDSLTSELGARAGDQQFGSK